MLPVTSCLLNSYLHLADKVLCVSIDDVGEQVALLHLEYYLNATTFTSYPNTYVFELL